MKATFPHIVQQFQLTLEVEETSKRDYSLLLEELSRLGNQVLPQVLEEALSSIFPADTYQRVERLEVEIEVDSLEEVARAFHKELPQRLRRVLAEQAIPTPSPGKASKLVADSGPGQWLYVFLRSGSLPSSAPRNLSLAQLAEQSQTWLAGQPKWRQRFYQLLLKQPQALWRLLQHLGAAWLWQFMQHERPKDKPEESSVRWQRTREYAKIEQAGQTAVLRFWQAELAEAAPPQKGPRSRGEEVEQRSVAHRTADPEEEQTGDQTSYYLDDAGLVLIHPFIPGLLETIHLAADQKIKDPAQAASVLYSLAWGQSPEAEWQLVLPKILLGIPLEQLVEVREVSPAELAAGEEMLTAAIAHWSVLGNTSVDGFRESFLQRPGRLDRKEEGWSLRLEQRPYDMLLEQLPWQWSFVKLPWMDQLIRPVL